MEVKLLRFTPGARDLLLFTKNTRLMTEPGDVDAVASWPEDKKQAELDYMRGTIQSSWEFVDYVFLITGVSRAFTHQLVRTRNASYAQQSQRTVDMSDGDFVMPEGLPIDVIAILRETARYIFVEYEDLIKRGFPPQIARSVLPTNVATNIVAKFNLRTLADMAKVRLCTRTQGEYQDVFRAMRSAVLDVHPWAEPFIRVYCAVTGTCCFPNYHECPIKQHTYNPNTGSAWGGPSHDADNKAPLAPDAIQVIWENTRFEAVPSEMPKYVERKT